LFVFELELSYPFHQGPVDNVRFILTWAMKTFLITLEPRKKLKQVKNYWTPIRLE